jgi:hypothetical protein
LISLLLDLLADLALTRAKVGVKLPMRGIDRRACAIDKLASGTIEKQRSAVRGAISKVQGRSLSTRRLRRTAPA